jgi:uncharacterized protein YfiM (DUF2279 family)
MKKGLESLMYFHNMKRIAVLSLVLCTHYVVGQSVFILPSDTLNKNRVIGVSTGLAGGSIAGMTGLWHLWYKDAEAGNWKFENDAHLWLQMDKAGHFYTAYQLNRTASSLYNWCGVDNTRSTLIGASYSLAFQTTLEIFDGFSSEWGFSWSDATANVLGTAAYSAQSLIWKEQRIIPKFSSFPSEYAELRPSVLGENFMQQLIKDYNGQTYWLSVSPGSFLKSGSFPKWLCLSIGYSVDAKIVGDEEFYIHQPTDRVYHSSREFLLSLDVDLSKLNIRKPWLKTIVNQFNYLKIPFPALIYSNGQVIGRPLYF